MDTASEVVLLASDWRSTCAVHGDMRTETCTIYAIFMGPVKHTSCYFGYETFFPRTPAVAACI